MAKPSTNEEVKYVQFTDFADPQSQLVTSENQNAYDLYCGQGCESLILRANIGTYVERSKEMLKLPDEKSTKESDSENSSSDDDVSNQGFWALSDIMAFENIGVSKTIFTGIKYLCCPSCGIGPLGYHDTNVKKNEFLIAADRVRYREE